jgi:xylan 1,4-beta-xylosidase
MLKLTNPILPGFHPDPSICRVGDDYYLATSTFQWFPGVELYHSKDLVNWEHLPSPLRRVSQLDMRGDPNSGGIWAPCLTYCDGMFYLIYTNVTNFHGNFKDTHNYLVTTTDIRGEWSEPIYLNSSGFDPSMFHDDDGKKYILNMKWDHREGTNFFAGILVQEYSPTEKKLIGKPTNIFKGTYAGGTEGPHMYKHNGYYYLLVAEGGTGYHHGIQMARSKTLLGEYEVDPQPVLTAKHNPESYLQRTGHGALVDSPNGDLFVTFLCGRPLTLENQKRRSMLGRETCIAPVVWNEDGWLRLKTGGIVPPIEFDVDKEECKYPVDPSYDDFNYDELPLHLKTLRLPFTKEIGSLTERKGCLRLVGNESITSWNKQSLVARRIQHFHMEATTEMEFDPETLQQMAGLIVTYDTYNFFYLYLTKDEESGQHALRLLARDNLKFYNPIEGGRVLIGENNHVWLRAERKDTSLVFTYSLDGKNFENIGGNLNCSNMADEAYGEIGHEGHTGPFVGMGCQDLTGEHKHADFFNFSYIAK